MMRILVSHSYNGGSGKTIFSVNVAKLLENDGKRVLLIESDFMMPSLSDIFLNITPTIFFNDYLNQDKLELSQYIHPSPENNFGVIFCNNLFSSKDKVNSTNLTWFNERREKLQRDLKKLNYDFVIFDLSPGMHLFTINILSIADYIFMISRPDFHSFKGTQHLFENIYSRAFRHTYASIYLLINQIPKFVKMSNEIENWNIVFKNAFPFIKKIFPINYEPETVYHTIVKMIILPETDPTLSIFKSIFASILS